VEVEEPLAGGNFGAVAWMQAMHDLLVRGSEPDMLRLVAEGHHRAAVEDAAWVRAHAAELAAAL
jgi:hypothetical protein